MSNYKSDYIHYRKIKSREAFSDAILLADEKRWNAAVNRLYYSCFYIVSAILLQYDIDAKTHAGVKNQFNLNFVKPGTISIDDGKLYSDLFDSRQKGDYGDLFDFDEDTVMNLLSPVGDFITRAENLLKH